MSESARTREIVRPGASGRRRRRSWRSAPRRLVSWAFRRQLGAGEELSDFQRYAWAMTSGFERLECVVAAVLLVGLWPLDAFIYPGDESRLWLSGAWRLVAASFLMLGVYLAERAERRRLSPYPVWIALSLLVIAASYSVASELGDPATPWVHTTLLVPVLSVTILVGLLARTLLTLATVATALVAYFAPHPAYLDTPHLTALFGSLAASCVMSIVIGHALFVLTRREFEARVDLRRLSRTDSLGVWNRKYFLARADEEVLRARRSSAPLAVLVLDLDRFKQINDRFGHATGDAVLEDLVARAATVFRRTDIFGRMGGEEFAVLLPDTPLAQAVDAAERLRRAVEESAQPGAAEVPGLPSYTVSIGCAALDTEDADVDSVLRRADRVLYQAKNAGRNMVLSDAGSSGTPPAG